MWNALTYGWSSYFPNRLLLEKCDSKIKAVTVKILFVFEGKGGESVSSTICGDGTDLKFQHPTVHEESLERSKKDPAWPLPGLDTVLVSIQWLPNPPYPQQGWGESKHQRKEPPDRQDSEKLQLITDKKEISVKWEFSAISFLPFYKHIKKKQHFTTFFYIEMVFKWYIELNGITCLWLENLLKCSAIECQRLQKNV